MALQNNNVNYLVTYSIWYVVVGILVLAFLWFNFQDEDKEAIKKMFKSEPIFSSIISITLVVVFWLPFVLWNFFIMGMFKKWWKMRK